MLPGTKGALNFPLLFLMMRYANHSFFHETISNDRKLSGIKKETALAASLFLYTVIFAHHNQQ